ncbi:hypothetical protein QYE76_064245 [Lolium multiflorum]|uniref:Uncharacterized protein n=1 Tax=Lolium multiflorum TaxID=4521 RepID=A0AAD8S8K0_LOLMU|nr:hypothetical protein QYE76_064245 [Lolium multiflorum]
MARALPSSAPAPQSLCGATITLVTVASAPATSRAHPLPLGTLGTTTPSTAAPPHGHPSPIKGALFFSNWTHHSLLLLTPPLLDLSIHSIHHHTTPITSSSPPVHGARRRRRPPLEARLLQAASSTSPTSSPRFVDPRRAAGEPTTPTAAASPFSPDDDVCHGAREHEVLPAWEWGKLDLRARPQRPVRPPWSPAPRVPRIADHDQPGGELQWIITADLRGKMEPPTSERILFSFMESNWLDGLARALQEGLARLCGMSGEALKHPRFSHLARRNSAGEPMDMSSHPELKHHVEHLDFMLYHTQQDLDHSREYANQTHARIIEQGDAIKMLANDRRTLRQQRAKRDATITRLRAKIAALEATVKAQEEQMKKMEEDGEDIQGGSNYLSDDNDFEEDENTEGEDYDFLTTKMMTTPPSMLMRMRSSSLMHYRRCELYPAPCIMAPPTRNANQDAMMQMLQVMLEDREAERAEGKPTLQHFNSLPTTIKAIMITRIKAQELPDQPAVFSKTEEPLDADDWLQTMENNLEVAGVEENEKVFCHALLKTSKSLVDKHPCMNAGQFITWTDFKLKFSKYAPDEADTTEKRKERFLNGLHDEMQTVLINIPFADLEALVDSAIQMEGKLHQAENRKRRMMNQWA